MCLSMVGVAWAELVITHCCRIAQKVVCNRCWERGDAILMGLRMDIESVFFHLPFVLIKSGWAGHGRSL